MLLIAGVFFEMEAGPLASKVYAQGVFMQLHFQYHHPYYPAHSS